MSSNQPDPASSAAASPSQDRRKLSKINLPDGLVMMINMIATAYGYSEHEVPQFLFGLLREKYPQNVAEILKYIPNREAWMVIEEPSD